MSNDAVVAECREMIAKLDRELIRASAEVSANDLRTLEDEHRAAVKSLYRKIRAFGGKVEPFELDESEVGSEDA